jgi:hypothetical protein
MEACRSRALGAAWLPEPDAPPGANERVACVIGFLSRLLDTDEDEEPAPALLALRFVGSTISRHGHTLDPLLALEGSVQG